MSIPLNCILYEARDCSCFFDVEKKARTDLLTVSKDFTKQSLTVLVVFVDGDCLGRNSASAGASKPIQVNTRAEHVVAPQEHQQRHYLLAP